MRSDGASASIRWRASRAEPVPGVSGRLDAWLAALEQRHLADLQFPEVTRALRALSSTYIERRSGLREGAALAGAGKRAAFALFYGPLHYLLLRAIAAELPEASSIPGTLVDLGCGTGAAGAGWASACPRPPLIHGVDRHPWAVKEAATSYRDLGISGRAVGGDIGRDPLPKGDAYLAAFTLNELTDEARRGLLARLLERATRGDRVLIVEPLARRVSPWWGRDLAPFLDAGGRTDEWRFTLPLPPIVAKLDQAAGLRHHAVTGRSLWIAGATTRATGPPASN